MNSSWLFFIDTCPNPGECIVRLDEVCCRGRTASPRGLGLEWTLQLPKGTHHGRPSCHTHPFHIYVSVNISPCYFDVFYSHGQALVDRLLSKTIDNSLLISRFQEFLELEDVRYYVMSSIRENVGKVMDKNKGVGELQSSAEAALVYCF